MRKRPLSSTTIHRKRLQSVGKIVGKNYLKADFFNEIKGWWRRERDSNPR